eukprot:349763-Chlamydomonas_euryale.AAC.5
MLRPGPGGAQLQGCRVPKASFCGLMSAAGASGGVQACFQVWGGMLSQGRSVVEPWPSQAGFCGSRAAALLPLRP